AQPGRRQADRIYSLRLRHAASLPAAGERGGTSDARRGTWDPAHRPSRDPDPAPCLGGAARARCALARLATSRFAGIGYGGRVTVAAAQVTLEGRFAWVLVDQLSAQPGRGRSRPRAGGSYTCTPANCCRGPLGVRRSTLDRVADLVSSARADEPHHEVEDEP